MADPTAGVALKKYSGNCHCGLFKFHMTVAELRSITQCNCSICFKKGYRWIFPGKGNVVVEEGEGLLSGYEFGERSMVHLFCGVCGTAVMGRRHGLPEGEGVGINVSAVSAVSAVREGLRVGMWVNVNTLMDVDPFAMEAKKYDGAALPPTAAPILFKGGYPDFFESGHEDSYEGGCHCGAVTLAIKDEELKNDANDDNCSICVRNGVVMTYPRAPNVRIAGDENLTVYQFGSRWRRWYFCKICGVTTHWEIVERDVKLEAKGTWGVNARCLEGVRWEEVVLEKGNMRDAGVRYVRPE